MMIARVLILFFISCTLFGRVQVQAQCLTGYKGDIQLSDEAVISLITVDPGNQIHAFWGHTALRIADPANGIDLMYNYGAFRFDAYFVPKFVYGKLDYILCVSHMRGEINKYRDREKRALIEQVLLLNQEEKQEVFEFVETNALPENRTYRYDFLFDNCSTRIRDILEDVLGERLTYHTEDPGRTWRQILQPYVTHFPFLSLGIDLGLGLPVDKEPAAHDLMGLPIYMMEAYDEALVNVNGEEQPLVTAKDTLLWVEPNHETGGGSPLVLYGLVWGLFAVGLWVTNSKASYSSRLRIWFDRLVFGIAGIAGLLAIFLWFISLHHVTDINFNVLWAWPTHFIIIWMLSRKKNAVKGYMRVCAVALVVVVLGWYFWPQELNVALLPIVLTMMVRSTWWGWNPASEGVVASSATA
ncbi:MAG: DUF4105 domain-containing protein [Rhodothermaceae bacterium]|nr:DUF4105 domain-containing protein [Rhodothermaceae bacterium]